MPCKALCDYRSYVSINALGRDSFERVSSYRYLGIWVDDRLSFRLCIENLVKKLKGLKDDKMYEMIGYIEQLNVQLNR